MSNYQQFTKHPDTGKWEFATWIDDHFGHHRYGIKFRDEKIFREEQIELVNPVVSLERVLVTLFDAGVITSTEIQQRLPPRHGTCCTCQDCGRLHDECVCSSNEILEAIFKLVEEEQS